MKSRQRRAVICLNLDTRSLEYSWQYCRTPKLQSSILVTRSYFSKIIFLLLNSHLSIPFVKEDFTQLFYEIIILMIFHVVIYYLSISLGGRSIWCYHFFYKIHRARWECNGLQSSQCTQISPWSQHCAQRHQARKSPGMSHLFSKIFSYFVLGNANACI